MSYTASGLAEHAKAALGLKTAYVWGGIFRSLTTADIDAKARQYPNWYTAARTQSRKSYAGKGYFGVDCIGLIKSYYWGGVGSPRYSAATDVNSDRWYNTAKQEDKGPISGIPEIPGLCVWMRGHIGVYIGGGEVIESTLGGYGDGVVKTKLQGRGWTGWVKCPYIEYGEDEDMTQEKFNEMFAAAQAAAAYQNYGDVPAWGRDAVKALMDAGALQGDGNGIKLSPDLLRGLVINDRMGLYK